MEIYITFMDWKIQHSQNVNVPQIIYTCNIIPLIFFAWLFVAIDKRILEFKTKRTIIFKIFFKKRLNLKESHYPILRYTMKLH